MKSEKLPFTFFGDFDNDMKAEVIAAELVEEGTPAERVLILMVGALKRSFQNDVIAIENEISEFDRKEYTIIKTPKEGFYDMLPEGLFHHPPAVTDAKTKKEIIRAIKQRKEEEWNARKFFIPFEAAINYMRMQMALYENKLDKRIYYNDLTSIFINQWEIFKYLDAGQANVFLHLIPILHNLRDNYPVIETIMEMILEVPIQINLCNQSSQRIHEPIFSKLGESSLGENFTTGNEFYEDGLDNILIKVGPISNEAFQLFRQGGVKQRTLELFCDYLLPVHLDIKVEYELNKHERAMKFANDSSFLNSVLAEDTFL